MEYNWYFPLLKQRLKSLKNLKKKASLEQALKIEYAIIVINALLAGEPHIDHSSSDNFEYNLESDYRYFKELKYLWPIAKGFSKSDNVILPEQPQFKLNDNDLFELINLFFKSSTNKKIYDLFLKIFKERRKNIHFLRRFPEDFYADSMYIPYYDEVYIQMAKKNNFLDVITLAHEFGHGIHFLSNANSHLLTNINPFIEIVSTFFELLCSYYFTKEGSFKKEAKATSYLEWEEIKMAANELKRELSLISEIEIEPYESKNNLRNNIRELLDNYSTDEIESILESNNANNFRYIVGYSIAVELFIVYKSDPDRAFYILNKLMNIDARLSGKEYYNKIQSFGIIPNENGDKYEDHIKKLILH